jgi:hypothetical protein
MGGTEGENVPLFGKEDKQNECESKLGHIQSVKREWETEKNGESKSGLFVVILLYLKCK